VGVQQGFLHTATHPLTPLPKREGELDTLPLTPSLKGRGNSSHSPFQGEGGWGWGSSSLRTATLPLTPSLRGRGNWIPSPLPPLPPPLKGGGIGYPPPSQGEGWGGGGSLALFLELFYHLSYPFCHGLRLPEHLVVPEPQHLPAPTLQIGLSLLIVRVVKMLAAIHFHHELKFPTGKIYDKRANDLLTAKFDPKPLATQKTPEELFALCHLAPHLAGSLKKMRIFPPHALFSALFRPLRLWS